MCCWLLAFNASAFASTIFTDGFEAAPMVSVPDLLSDAPSASRFLGHTSFGPSLADIEQLTGSSSSAWFRQQLTAPATSYLDRVFAGLEAPGATDGSGQPTFLGRRTPNHAFWTIAIGSDDQLRQRMAFALSQILVISNAMNTQLFDWPTAVGYYQSLLVDHAFGNYRDLLEAVTYSPAMGSYLTYLQNTRGDPSTGRVPDENYAREIMQLFTIGLVALNPDGTPQRVNGQPVELYDNSDVTGLARVFTGLSLDSDAFFFGFNELNAGTQFRPMRAFPEWHSTLEKRFLGTTIAAGTGPIESIEIALDALFNHPNTPPFLARQLIQRFVTSDPEPAYVARVAQAFTSGRFILPDASAVGSGQRGDLSATLAAIIFDPEARLASAQPDRFGKLREPVLRLTQWARAFQATDIEPSAIAVLDFTGASEDLSQSPFQSPSVFNFYRPAFVAPGSLSGAQGMTVPELQIVNANSVFGYSNFIGYFISGAAAQEAEGRGVTSFVPNYSRELALAANPSELVDHLDLLLSHGSASAVTKNRITQLLTDLPLQNPADANYDGPRQRVELAIQMLMTSPDYLVQR